MDGKELHKLEIERRREIVIACRKAIVDMARKMGTDPELNLKLVMDDFKKTLADMELPFSRMTLKAMIEGAQYIQQAERDAKNGDNPFPPSMSLGLLMVMEDEMRIQNAVKMKNLDESTPHT